MYTTGAHNVARAHASCCAAAESDFGLCPFLSLAGLIAHTIHTQNITCTLEHVCSSAVVRLPLVICRDYILCIRECGRTLCRDGPGNGAAPIEPYKS